MRNLLPIVSIILLAGSAMAQSHAVNSMSDGTTQNQRLTGITGHTSPPQPILNGGEPDAGDRVSGTPANATTMHLESETTPAAELNTSVAGGGKVAQEAVFESATQNSAPAGKRTQH